MRSRMVTAALGLVWIALACSGEEPRSPEADARFQAAMDSVDLAAPGASLERLQDFLSDHERYPLADSMRAESGRLRLMIRGRYHEARELARAGEFDRAQWMLEDLARVPETPDGASAKQHLEFDFHYERAKWLLARQRFDESETAARALLSRRLDRTQADQVEAILDNAGHAGAVMDLSARSRMENACQQLVVILANIYINDGVYPERLSMADLQQRDPYSFQFLTRDLKSIEDYQATQDHYSLVAVDKNGRGVRIVDGQFRR